MTQLCGRKFLFIVVAQPGRLTLSSGMKLSSLVRSISSFFFFFSISLVLQTRCCAAGGKLNLTLISLKEVAGIAVLLLSRPDSD